MKYLLILVVFLFFKQSFGQDISIACNDTLIYTLTDTPPILLTPVSKLEKILEEKILLSKKQSRISGHFALQFTVNCSGDSGNYKTIKINNEQVDSKLEFLVNKTITLLSENTIWEPASQKKTKVDHRVVFMIIVDEGTFRIKT